jgi:hypothetical protein
MLSDIYNSINKKNKHLVPQTDLDGYCRALWCEEGFALNSRFKEMLDELKEICGEAGIYYDLGDAEKGLLHFTLFQLQTFKVDPASWSVEKAKDVGDKLMKILATEPPFSISYKSLVKTSNGIFMSGFPSYDVNRVRHRIRAEFGDEVVEPHPQDIFHSTVMRLAGEVSEETMTKIDFLVSKYSGVGFGEVQPAKWIYGYGTWTQRVTQKVSSWAAAPRYWILHRGLSNGPDTTLENNYENLLVRIGEGWHVEVDVWFEDGRWWLGHDYEVAKLREISYSELEALSTGSWFHCKNVAALAEMSRLNQGWRFFSHDRDEAVLTSTSQIWCYPGIFCERGIAVLPEKCDQWSLGQNRLIGVCSDYLPEKFSKMDHDVTFLIQGPMSNHIDLMKQVKEYSQFGHIVISTYQSDEFKDQIEKVTEYASKNNIKLIVTYNNLESLEVELKSKNKYLHLNDDPHSKLFNNCYYHINTVLNGLKYVKTRYIVKVRIDSYFSNMSNFINKMKKINKIICSSVFVRGYTNNAINIKFHPSDILFGGNTENINSAFKLALENYEPGVCEVNIWKPYIVQEAEKNNITINHLNNDTIYVKHMCDTFEVFSIKFNTPYHIRGNSNITEQEETTEHYFTYGVRCSGLR